MQYKTFAEKEADNGEKIFKDFNNFINMKIKTLFKTIFLRRISFNSCFVSMPFIRQLYRKNTGAYYWLYI